MPVQPLTHHEILGLVGPFTRRGRKVDLAASNRLERRLAFEPVEHAGALDALAGAREGLALENPRPGLFRLTRTLTLACGLRAALEAEGSDVDELLDRIESVPLQSHVRTEAGVVIAQSYRIGRGAADASENAPSMRMVLTHGAAEIDGFSVVLNAETLKRHLADIQFSPPRKGAYLEPPEDLLAVLGRDWGRMRPRWPGWSCSLRAPGREPARSRRVETRFAETVAHLAQTLAEPPRRFHDRLVGARWRVALRRTTPVMVLVAVLAGAFGLVFLDIPANPFVHLLILDGALGILALPLCMHDQPRLEIPPLPRPSKAPSWRKPTPESSVSLASVEPAATQPTQAQA
jgi:hypothetical protein